MAPSSPVSVVSTERIFPETPTPSERAVPLSLLDATTAELAFTQATWLFERPEHVAEGFDLTEHLRAALRTALSAYPQWCGQCRAITSLTGPTRTEAKDFPPHARRLGRIYAHFGASQDPGVEFITAVSAATGDNLYPADRTETRRLWNRHEADLKAFAPATVTHRTLRPNDPDEKGLRKALLAIQLTQLSCGGFVLAAQSAHPMADISALVHLMKDWGKVSTAMLRGEPLPTLSPVFDPAMVDSCAAGDINTETPDAEFVKQDRSLPMHRYDWWAKSSQEGCPWPTSVPEAFRSEALEPAGPPMPWKTWDITAPVSNYIIHLTSEQVDYLYDQASRQPSSTVTRVSKHDAILAHIWSCIARARQQQDDDRPIHCDLTIGVRPVLQLGENFIGSPITIINIETTGRQVAAAGTDPVARSQLISRIRSTIGAVDRDALAAHLHGVAFEKSPQRIWQAFLGSRHFLVTTWARAGVYEIDFGLGAAVRYADGVVPDMDGCTLIKEAPPPPAGKVVRDGRKKGWTDNGVDVSLALRKEDMERLLRDPLLLPRV